LADLKAPKAAIVNDLKAKRDAVKAQTEAAANAQAEATRARAAQIQTASAEHTAALNHFAEMKTKRLEAFNKVKTARTTLGANLNEIKSATAQSRTIAAQWLTNARQLAPLTRQIKIANEAVGAAQKNATAAQEVVKKAEAVRDEQRRDRAQIAARRFNLRVKDQTLAFFDEQVFNEANGLSITGNTGQNLRSRALGDGNIFYAYIYHYNLLHLMPLKVAEHPLIKDLTYRIFDLPVGAYAVEVWDCFNGKILSETTQTLTAEKPLLEIPLPDFPIQIALKIRKR
jgi:hypothetical protein